MRKRPLSLSTGARFCGLPGKMPRFLTGDELGNLKAYVTATEDTSVKIRCSELLVETSKQKSVQKLAIARSTVRSILREFARKFTNTGELKRRLPPLLLMEQFLSIP